MKLKATGKELRELIKTGTCPSCRGALQDQVDLGNEVLRGGVCDVCGARWSAWKRDIMKNKDQSEFFVEVIPWKRKSSLSQT